MASLFVQARDKFTATLLGNDVEQAKPVATPAASSVFKQSGSMSLAVIALIAIGAWLILRGGKV